MGETKKPTIRASKIQICVAAILVILAGVLPSMCRYIEYRHGLSGSVPGTSLLVILIYILLFCLLGTLSFVVGIFHIYRDPRPFSKSFVAVILVLIPIIIAYISLKFFPTGNAEDFLNGFSKWVVANVDLDELEKWRPNVPEQYWETHYRYDFPKAIPSFAVIFKPKFISFSEYISDPDVKSIKFGWGGGMSEWGFVITEPSEETSKPGEINIIKIHESLIEIRRTVRPGVYVYEVG
jgi:hypothetical protein